MLKPSLRIVTLASLLVVPMALTACSDSRWLGRADEGMRASNPRSPNAGATDIDDLSPFAPPIATGSDVPLFQSDEVLEVELRDGGETDTLSYLENGIRSEVPVTRTELSDGSRHCRFPSFVLTVRQSLTGTIFENSRGGTFRFIAHCDGRHRVAERDWANQEVFERYTLYRALRAAGFLSFETRLAHIAYRDPHGKMRAEAYGFFLESPEDAAARYRLELIPPGTASDQGAREIDPRAMISFALAERLVAEPRSKSLPVDAVLFRNASGRVIPALGSLSRSELIGNDDDCDGNACDRDGEFLESLLRSGDQPSPADWQRTVLKQASRVAISRPDVLAVLDRNPLSDLRKFRARFEAYFDSLDAFSAAHP